MNDKRDYIDRNQYLELAGTIIKNLENSPFLHLQPRPKIIGILNGGKMLADYLSIYFNLPISYIQSHSREGEPGSLGIKGTKGTIDLSIPISLLNQSNKQYLIVDDIYESGTTMKTIQKLFPNSRSCVLIHKAVDSSQVKTDFYGKIVSPEVWIDFYWEK